MPQKKKAMWSDLRYLIIDEVSMLDLRTIQNLQNQFSIAKSSPDLDFGGVNIIFMGDFLQIPPVSRLNLYLRHQKWEQGYTLWQKLNSVVILRDQVRQHEDP
jgi:PIF1-like helicase